MSSKDESEHKPDRPSAQDENMVIGQGLDGHNIDAHFHYKRLNLE